MSEYQCYQFQTVDKPLSKVEMQEIARLSSRIKLTTHKAIFVYNYGDFPADAGEILLKYFDAMTYVANWGSRRLMFRFPESIVNIEEIKQFCFRDSITLKCISGFAVLDIHFFDEENSAWIDENDWLSSFLPLRNDLIEQDYRLLYLAWLKAVNLNPPEEDEKYFHPTVPQGLRNLPQSIKDFIELFDIDEFLIRAVAKFSPKKKKVEKLVLKDALSKLSQEECNDFLLRLALNEPYLSVQLKRRLEEVNKQDSGDVFEKKERQTVSAFLDQLKNEREQEIEKQRALEEQKRIQELEKLSRQEPQLWNKIALLINEKKAYAYDEAVNILLNLKELAGYKKTVSIFQEKLNKIHMTHKSLSGLRRRLNENGLHQEKFK